MQFMMKGRQSKSTTTAQAAPFLFLILVLILLFLRSSLQVSIKSKSWIFTPSAPAYDPKNCSQLVNGHCDDKDGGAWTYRNGLECTYVEQTPMINNAPQDFAAVKGLPGIFPGVKSVMDFGGGVGVYLTGFRNKGVSTLVTVEPVPLGSCLFAGMVQDSTDWINTPLSQLPSNKFDLVMTIEAAEHIPVNFHQHLIQALAQATSKWLLFSAAHPGQAGEGHVGPSMKTKAQWIREIESWTSLKVDMRKTEELYGTSGYLLKANSVIFRKD
ncbi:hypothetical protein MHU86_8308 [Fragilaria crotonensis]|nr:hypothetical protein MHU86_8308 [Fragilaria crotonensis]